MSTLIAVLLEALVEGHSDRVVLGGTANLTEHPSDFPVLQPVLEALEEQVVLLRLLDQSATSSQIVVSIGNENEHAGLVSTSVVASSYRARGTALGAVGVLGPRRMDYGHTMARVAAVARYVGELLAER
jgi:heat-inducible transcriptional repressor